MDTLACREISTHFLRGHNPNDHSQLCQESTASQLQDRMYGLQVPNVNLYATRNSGSVSGIHSFSLARENEDSRVVRGMSRAWLSIETQKPRAGEFPRKSTNQILTHRRKGHEDVLSSPETSTCFMHGNPNNKEVVRRCGELRVLPNSSLAERSSELGDGQEESVGEDANLASITEWELDFCSRPILDSRGKKVWELVVCDSQRQLRFARFYPNNVINSGTLRDAMMYIIQTLGVPKPQKIRFFRSQMQTIIGKACGELDIRPVPSQRCVQLIRWLDERYETVYSQHPGFQEGAGPLTLLEQPLPVDVPDTLRGEQWAFVQLPLSALLEEIAAVERGDNFGSVFDLETLGINLPPNSMIPGVAVASTRATPLAAWTNALELASLDVETPQACLVLSSGVSDRYRYAFWRRGEQADQEAQSWEKAKRQVGGLHFLAVQQSLDSEMCAGFWLLLNPPKSPV